MMLPLGLQTLLKGGSKRASPQLVACYVSMKDQKESQMMILAEIKR